MLLSFPKTACNTASIFSAKYKPSIKYDFKSSYIRDRKERSKTFRRLKATFANFSNASIDSLIDYPLMNITITIKPLRTN
jgi:hypothetical protein